MRILGKKADTTCKASLMVSPVRASKRARLERCVRSVARPPRLLRVLERGLQDDKLILRLHGAKVDLYVLANSLATAFPKLKVTLELERKDLAREDAGWSLTG